MRVKVLGTAAGGGFPQWNCACKLCSRVRMQDTGLRRRFHSSIAISSTGKNWYVIDATPDIRLQIESFDQLHPGPGVRETPLRGVVLTDAELDHTIGLLVLREGSSLTIYGTASVLTALSKSFPVQEMLSDYASTCWSAIAPGKEFLLDEGNLKLHPIPLGEKKPRFASQLNAAQDWVLGYRLQDLSTGGSIIYAPSIARWTEELSQAIPQVQCALLDGTFWSENELKKAGACELEAKDMGHLPVSGPGGIAERLREHSSLRKILVHINNTNPILMDASPEQSSLNDAGIEVGYDGMEISV